MDALNNKLDELENEWNQKDDRKNEIRKLKEETEQAYNKHLEINSQLSEAEEKFTKYQELLGKEKNLIDSIKNLEDQKTGLESNSLIANKELDELNEQIGSEKNTLESIKEEIKKIVSEKEELEEEISNTNSLLNHINGDIQESINRRESLKGEIAKLETREEELNTTIKGLEGKLGDTIQQKEDHLEEIKTPPQALTILSGKTPQTQVNELEALKRVKRRFESQGLKYHRRTLYAFHTAMKSNETSQMAVLAGISGTGKTQLPRQYANAMGIGFLQVSVQPRWDSPQDLMGFYNYLEKRFRPTDMARALFQMDKENNPETEFSDHLMMVLLDEMNLARVEYYFSDFLSRLENRPSPDRVNIPEERKDAELELEIPVTTGQSPRIFPGYNLLFVGTMNEDESTQTLSEKVIDRANVLRFAAPKKIMGDISQEEENIDFHYLRYTDWKQWIRESSNYGEREFVTKIEKMAEIMKKYERPFGYRLGNAILSYVANYPRHTEDENLNEALADQVEMRLLPKLRGIELDQSNTLSELIQFVENDLDDPVLSEAINKSEQIAHDSTGQFRWLGVNRDD
ncbi:chromosome segregation ATPase-like protein [Candidatus Saccharibacteria bacterium]|nr:chromosome segregation ATPase-like protein [Candidatus Saccharibacteria bacterium]